MGHLLTWWAMVAKIVGLERCLAPFAGDTFDVVFMKLEVPLLRGCSDGLGVP